MPSTIELISADKLLARWPGLLGDEMLRAIAGFTLPDDPDFLDEFPYPLEVTNAFQNDDGQMLPGNFRVWTREELDRCLERIERLDITCDEFRARLFFRLPDVEEHEKKYPLLKCRRVYPLRLANTDNEPETNTAGIRTEGTLAAPALNPNEAQKIQAEPIAVVTQPPRPTIEPSKNDAEQSADKPRGKFVGKAAEARKETGVLAVEKKDCFISYTTRTEADKRWAIWLEWFLREKLRNSTLMREYDSPPDGNFKMFMDAALRQADIVVCILSNTYMQSNNCKEEWTNAKGLRLVKVDDCKPEGLLTSRAYIDLYGLDEAAAMEKLTREWVLPQRPKENPGFPATVFTSTTSPEKPDVPFEQKPSTETGNEPVTAILARIRRWRLALAERENDHAPEGVKPKKSKQEIIFKVCSLLVVLLSFAILFSPFYIPTVDSSDEPIFNPIAFFISLFAATIVAGVAEKTSRLRRVGGFLAFVLLLIALGLFLRPRLWAPHWQVIAMSPSEVWSDGRAYSAYANGEFNLSRVRSIRLTFDSIQAGIKFRLRLAPASADLNEPSGVRWEMVSIPSNGIVTLPLKPEDFSLKREDMRQLIQIAVLSGDNAWNRHTMQGTDMQAVFHKIEVLTGK
jgi:hypothetical protein